jgi:hypothetical protein
MTDNPWVRLPAAAPYVLVDDEKDVLAFNAKASEAHRLRIDQLLPEPFVGDPAAPVLLLSNNPGLGKNVPLRQRPEFMARVRDALGLQSRPVPFIYLEPQFSETGHWWRQKLKCLLQRFGDAVVTRSVCNVVYFPYPSREFKRWRRDLPSQAFGFRLVQEAVARRAVVVLMRKGKWKWWRDRVPGLDGYENLVVLRNPQMPSVSPTNCEVGDYEKVTNAIEQVESRGQHAAVNMPVLSPK